MDKRRGLGIPMVAMLILLTFASSLCRAETAGRLTLQESIDTALKQSVTIHASKEGVAGAEAQRKEAMKAFLPKFGTTYSYTRLSETPTFNFPAVPPFIPAQTFPAGTKDNYTWTLEVKQPIFTGGSLLANYRINRIGADIARQEETASIQDVILDAKTSYFNILKAERILDVARQSVEQLQAHRDTAQSFFDVGIIPKNDLLYAEVQLANGHQYLVRADNGVALAKSKFNTVLRRDINTPVEVEDIMTYKPFEETLDDCLAMAMKNRAEIEEYGLRVEQAENAVKLARSGYFPFVSAIGNYSRYGDKADVSGSQFKDRESWYLMAAANWDFWEWGRTGNRVDYSRTRVNQAQDVLINLRDQITLEVKSAYLLLREAEKQIKVTEKAIEQAEENYRISEERYREQVATSTDVLDAQTLLTKAKSDYHNALGDYNISQARLQRAMGVR